MFDLIAFVNAKIGPCKKEQRVGVTAIVDCCCSYLRGQECLELWEIGRIFRTEGVASLGKFQLLY